MALTYARLRNPNQNSDRRSGPFYRRVLRQRLTESGFAVRCIADGAAAVATVAEHPPHLVIIDWNVLGYTAVDLIQAIRATRSPQAIRLIILSALAEEPDVVAGLECGADDYIAKPFSLLEATARVAAVLRSRQRSRQATI